MLRMPLLRRQFLKGVGMIVVTATVAPFRAQAFALTPSTDESYQGILNLTNLHTGEQCESCFWQHGHFNWTGLRKLDKLLRDFRANEMIPMDTALYQQLDQLQQKVGRQLEFEIISGYRSPATNEALRRQSSGVARKSYHMSGRAVDIRVVGLSTQELHQLAMSLQAGGVGYYPGSNFIHLDTGPVRNWRG